MIYGHILGGMVLHNSRRGPSRPKWIICRATVSETDAQRRFDQAKAPTWYVQDDADRHAECYDNISHLPRLDLNLLLVCHQVHREAKHILFSSNTFSFRRCAGLRTFLGVDMPTKPLRLVPCRSHHLAICSIHLNISIQCMKDAESWKMIMPQIAKVLPNLWNINISFTQGTPFFSYDYKDPSIVAREDAAQWKILMESLLDLASLPLRSATFDINDRNVHHRWCVARSTLPAEAFQAYLMAEELYCWTLEEKQARARAVKDAILRSSS